jgi:hypothetical protein
LRRHREMHNPGRKEAPTSISFVKLYWQELYE